MAGRVLFCDEAVHAMNRKQRAELARRRIGMVFQSYHLLDDLTVAENIDLPLSYKDIPKPERQALVADTLDRFNIVGKKDLYPSQLSGGQQQLVGIARAVIHRPALLLADEPTGNLQSAQAKEIMEMFRQLNEQGTTIVQVTHSEANAQYGTRTIELRDGWLYSDTAQAGADSAGGAVVRRFFPSLCCLACVCCSDCSRRASAAGARLRRCSLRCGWIYRTPIIRSMPTARRWCRQPNLANSPRIDTLIHDGVLELSLKDAIALALENNLDLAIARYNIPIAEADILRTRAGGSFRGVNTGVVQNTPGGGVGGFGSASSGAGAGGTSGGAGGAGSGASGLVQSTLGTGTNVSSYDPTITGTLNNEHYTQPLVEYFDLWHARRCSKIRQRATSATRRHFRLAQRCRRSSTTIAVRPTAPTAFLNPTLNSYYHVALQQQLLAGFGFGPNLRYLRIAKNNQKISDAAFKLQVVTTVTQIANMYWDLVAAYEDEQVKSQSLDFAKRTLDSGRKQLALQAIPAMDVMKDEGEVANGEQDLTIAKIDAAVSGVADQERADEEPGRPDSGGDAGTPDRPEHDQDADDDRIDGR